MYDWGKLFYPLLKTMSVRKAYNCREKKRKVNRTGNEWQRPTNVYAGLYRELYIL